MTTVTQADIAKAVQTLGISTGDTIMVHSSFKSMGYVDGGAEAVIGGFLDVIGDTGTLVFPTLVQKDFEHAYETWHLDKESDVGYLTNYFRKRPGSFRSDQATHSVAACGFHARELTKTHGHTHKRFGNFGDTPFSADSPWEKMYKMGGKIVLLGVSAMKITFRHYAEYYYIEQCLNLLKEHPAYEEMKSRLCTYNSSGVWPHLYSESLMEKMEKQHLVQKSQCGDAQFMCLPIKEFVDIAIESLTSHDDSVLWRIDAFDVEGWLKWRDDLEALTLKHK